MPPRLQLQGTQVIKFIQVFKTLSDMMQIKFVPHWLGSKRLAMDV